MLFIVYVTLYAVFCFRVTCYFVTRVFVCCFIVVPLPQGETPFRVQKIITVITITSKVYILSRNLLKKSIKQRPFHRAMSC
jgi:hypothetical protein